MRSIYFLEQTHPFYITLFHPAINISTTSLPRDASIQPCNETETNTKIKKRTKSTTTIIGNKEEPPITHGAFIFADSKLKRHKVILMNNN